MASVIEWRNGCILLPQHVWLIFHPFTRHVASFKQNDSYKSSWPKREDVILAVIAQQTLKWLTSQMVHIKLQKSHRPEYRDNMIIIFYKFKSFLGISKPLKRLSALHYSKTRLIRYNSLINYCKSQCRDMCFLNLIFY